MYALVFTETFENTQENKGKYTWMGRLPQKGQVFDVFHTELSCEIAKLRNINFKLIKVPFEVVVPKGYKETPYNFDGQEPTLFDRLSVSSGHPIDYDNGE